VSENQLLEGYTDLTRIGRGGMATIYRGHQTSLNRTVAIKFLSVEHLWDHQAQQLFDQESLVIAQLNHRNIVHIIDRGFTNGGRPYFVMEYIEGQTLAEKMQQTSMTPLARVMLSMQICSGLAYAHKNSVIHRDIKPANLLIDDEGHLRILDFGIAWLNTRGNPDGEAVLGTPDYMSPEQFTSPDRVSQQSDIYSLGAVMFQLFTGNKHVDDIMNWQSQLTSLQPMLAELIGLQSSPDDRTEPTDWLSCFGLIRCLYLRRSQPNRAQLHMSSSHTRQVHLHAYSNSFLAYRVCQLHGSKW